MSEETNSTNDANEIIYLSDDSGNEEPYAVLGVIEYDGCEYAILYPESGEDGVVEIVRVEELNNEEDVYLPVDDDQILDEVFALFKEQYGNDYDFD